jgi:hypothetical protein
VKEKKGGVLEEVYEELKKKHGWAMLVLKMNINFLRKNTNLEKQCDTMTT